MGTKIADAEKTGKVAIVTGGSKGIGASTVKQLVEKGHKVVIGDIAENEGLALTKELNKTSDSAFFGQLDGSLHGAFWRFRLAGQ
jgi:3alpha(or 20beta)-hydroxysteroid dehydrogenase